MKRFFLKRGNEQGEGNEQASKINEPRPTDFNEKSLDK